MLSQRVLSGKIPSLRSTEANAEPCDDDDCRWDCACSNRERGSEPPEPNILNWPLTNPMG
jgi:hypothetical protein